ncbi:MAG TPA: hypothetical protein PLQ93_06165 [Bacteroidia bacterium]|nr:hypothetical protein [Bacteroidia bacterium]
MKKILLFLMLGLSSAVFAQNQKSCFLEYYDLFDKRGSNPIPDGVQNVVVTVRDTKENSCFTVLGQVEVKNNAISGPLKIKNRKGEFVPPGTLYPKTTVHEKYDAPKSNLKRDYSIKNGMTANFLTQDMKVVNFFFIDYLKPQPSSAAEAPSTKKL